VRRRLCLAALVLSTGCATAPLKKPDLAALADADARVLQGCYDCLLEARDIYRRVAVGKARSLVVARLFETTLLIALRERELALDSSAAMGEAERLATELPPEAAADRYVAIAKAVPLDDIGTPRSRQKEFRSAHASFESTVDAEMAWLATGTLQPATRQYLALSIDCGYELRPRAPGQPRRPSGARDAPPGAPPLVIYRTATCGVINQPALFKLREANDRFAEASFWLGRFDIAVAQQRGPGHARERMAEALARFPQSPAVTYLSGSLQQLLGNCDAALAAYDTTLSLAPGHESAMLGRTICLTYLERHEDAIAEATRLIGTDGVVAGYYWRAFNRHVRKELDLARADIEQAKSRANTIDILTLAGTIEYDQEDLSASETDFTTARRLPYGMKYCAPPWFLGLIQMKRQAWLESAKYFEGAMNCYEQDALEAEAAMLSMQSQTDLDAEYKASQIAGLQKRIKAATSQRYASAFNAANYYATGGTYDAARRLVEIAATDPALADRVARLKDWLKGKGGPFSKSQNLQMGKSNPQSAIPNPKYHLLSE
jgi:hypothetical protein